MNAVGGPTESRPTSHHTNNELVGRDSVEPIASDTAKRRLLSRPGEPLFYANWDNLVFIHYETDPLELQRSIPYPLDLYQGRAFVSLVAFTMRRMRPRFGGRIGELLLKPIATHDFLNVRTYVRHEGEPGISFMREWLSSRLATCLGPWSFGLPYRFGRIEYSVDSAHERQGEVQAKEGLLNYRATLAAETFRPCVPGSLDEFLLERYSAFTRFGKRFRFFRIWHEPWLQVTAEVRMAADDLTSATGPWQREACCIGANYSPGVTVWMGWPHQIEGSTP
jgi:uncharacterized protein